MKKSRLLVLTLVFVFVLSVSAGALLLDYEEEFGEINFEGESITYVCWYNPLGEFEEGGEYAGRLEEAKDKFNIGDIELIQVGWGEDLSEIPMSRLLGGESNYDIWILPHQNVWPLITQGAFYPLNEILPEDYYGNMARDLRVIAETLSHRGEYYATGVGADHYSNIHLLFWNKDIIDREGLTPLNELYNQDNLTWEVIEEYAETVTRDTSGDGEIDQWAFGSFDPVLWASSNNALVSRRDEDGQMKFTFDNEEGLYAIEKLLEWENAGYFGAGWERIEVFEGLVAMDAVPLWFFERFYDELEDDWGVVPLPRGPHTDDYVYFSYNVDNVYIPANATDPEKLVAVHNFLFRQEEQLADREDFRIEMSPDQTTYEVLIDVEESWSGESYLLEGILGPHWDGGRPFGAVMSPILYEGADPATEFAAGRDAIQATIDDLFDQ